VAPFIKTTSDNHKKCLVAGAIKVVFPVGWERGEEWPECCTHTVRKAATREGKVMKSLKNRALALLQDNNGRSGVR